MIRKTDILVSDLCEEIDCLREEVRYYKDLYDKEVRFNAKVLNERLEESKKGVANALMFCLAIKDQPDGSMTISKEDRNNLSENYK